MRMRTMVRCSTARRINVLPLSNSVLSCLFFLSAVLHDANASAELPNTHQHRHDAVSRNTNDTPSWYQNDMLFDKQQQWRPAPSSSSSSSSSSLSLLSTTRIRHRNPNRLYWWFIPVLSCAVSYGGFGLTSRWFHDLVQWASSNTWIPKTGEDVNLQTNVVTQVVNGPVITSISVLFASLVGLTVSNLHSRQVDIHKSLIMEVHYLRELQQVVHQSLQHHPDQPRIRACLEEHIQLLLSRRYATVKNRSSSNSKRTDAGGGDTEDDCCAHTYIESSLPTLLSYPELGSLARSIMHQRAERWMALQTAPFPMAHYVTLAVLALSIVISFLVATAQAEFIFLTGLPVRLLWSVLMTSFTALGVVCLDLAQPFDGFYHIEL